MIQEQKHKRTIIHLREDTLNQIISCLPRDIGTDGGMCL